MKPRIMYIELKSHPGGHDDNGPAWISRVTFSKTGKAVYWRDKLLQRLPSPGRCGNHYDAATGEEYWVSGPKRNGEDRYPWGNAKVEIDEDAREEYWTEIRGEPERVRDTFVRP